MYLYHDKVPLDFKIGTLSSDGFRYASFSSRLAQPSNRIPGGFGRRGKATESIKAGGRAPGASATPCKTKPTTSEQEQRLELNRVTLRLQNSSLYLVPKVGK